jgi:hypothetical protein
MRNRSLFLLATTFASACAASPDSDGPGPGFGGKGDNPWDSDQVVSNNEFATYGTTTPYVTSVKWSHPKIKKAMAALGPGWRSTFSYGDWKKAYGLESESAGSETQQRDARVRNFIRVLAGENRDHPELLEARLDTIIAGQVYAGPDELTSVDLDENLFSQITYPAYTRLINVMQSMHRFRTEQRRHDNDGFNYNFGEDGHDSKRVENSVPPTTHCEMKFIFSNYLVAGSPRIQAGVTDSATAVKPETFETQYAAYQASDCSADDLAWMYNFRGHKNMMPLWFESNAFVWNSRRGGKALSAGRGGDYYLHPFADRYHRSRQAWGAYLLYRDEDHARLRAASESGGGPIMYLTDSDSNADGIADYKLFDQDGCGDNGLGGSNPNDNCNMVDWDTAASHEVTTDVIAGYVHDDHYRAADMGFFDLVGTFEQRMARFNQALDRHTNWGPTSYYMEDASPENASASQIRYIGAYSPIVACSYDISASNSFASGDYPTTPPFEQGVTKWMFVMKYRADNYYDEVALRDGKKMNFDKHYFNETSLSNDYYVERALDRFGWVPGSDLHANIYFVYGARGEQPPALEEIPAP